jgi:hypothetical protein
MNAARIVGALLIVLGLAALVYRGFSYTTKDTVIDVGAVEITRDDRDFVALPPILGGAAVVVGAALLFTSSRRGR